MRASRAPVVFQTKPFGVLIGVLGVLGVQMAPELSEVCGAGGMTVD